MPSTTSSLFLLGLLFAFLYRASESDNQFSFRTKPRFYQNTRLSTAEQQNILLLTAHPDDECMFFGPTLAALIAQRQNVFSMCLSTGNQDGLGVIRKKELGKSLDMLGVRKVNQRVVDHADLQDNITVPWSPQVIAQVVGPFVLEKDITMILTFDHHGVSNHPNHKALPEGMKNMVALYPRSSPYPPPRIFTLVSVPLESKYMGIIAPFVAKLVVHLRHALPAKLLPLRGRTIFVSGINEYLTSLHAMRQHQSQLVWFRWLYVLFSRYMWVNEWVEFAV